MFFHIFQAVSYTHLDVYKRQGRGCPLHRQGRHISRNTVAGRVELAVASEPHKVTARISVPVSYTHLDVYKRQGQGGFDRLCGHCVYELKKEYPHINNYLVIPYLSFNVYNRCV